MVINDGSHAGAAGSFFPQPMAEHKKKKAGAKRSMADQANIQCVQVAMARSVAEAN
jgi:hypothetical protein